MRHLRIRVLILVAVSMGFANAQGPARLKPVNHQTNAQVNEHWVATWAAPLRFAPLALPIPSGAPGQTAAGNARPPASAPQNTASGPPPAASPTPAPPANA